MHMLQQEMTLTRRRICRDPSCRLQPKTVSAAQGPGTPSHLAEHKTATGHAGEADAGLRDEGAGDARRSGGLSTTDLRTANLLLSSLVHSTCVCQLQQCSVAVCARHTTIRRKCRRLAGRDPVTVYVPQANCA